MAFNCTWALTNYKQLKQNKMKKQALKLAIDSMNFFYNIDERKAMTRKEWSDKVSELYVSYLLQLSK